MVPYVNYGARPFFFAVRFPPVLIFGVERKKKGEGKGLFCLFPFVLFLVVEDVKVELALVFFFVGAICYY